TTLLASLTHDAQSIEATDIAISSIIDTWILLRMIETAVERNRGICVLKSRGMNHSNQIRAFQITDRGVKILGPDPGSDAEVSEAAGRQGERLRATMQGLRKAGRPAQRTVRRKRNGGG